MFSQLLGSLLRWQRSGGLGQLALARRSRRALLATRGGCASEIGLAKVTIRCVIAKIAVLE